MYVNVARYIQHIVYKSYLYVNDYVTLCTKFVKERKTEVISVTILLRT